MEFRKFLASRTVFFLWAGILGASCADLCAAEPEAPWLQARASALVTVQSTGVAGLAQRGAGVPANAFPGQTRRIRFTRSGSGVIIDSRGIIVTNDHTIRHASSVFVVFSDGTRVRARRVGAFPGTDVAFLSIVPPFALEVVPFADSDKISKGSRVYTLGRSLWHKNTWFLGQITGMMAGTLRGSPHISLLQVTFGTELYLGDSGSPIFDRNGKLLGMVVAGRRNGDKATFAVASNFIREALQKTRREMLRSPASGSERYGSVSFLDRMRRISGEPGLFVPAP